MNINLIKNSKSSFLGKNVYFYDEITSTHEFAELYTYLFSNGSLILADMQTKGKGTKDHSWFTGKGKNIAMTIVLKPHCLVSDLDNLTKLIAESMVTTIYNLYSIKLSIKDPNDLFYNQRKIGGILTTIHSINEKVSSLLISIGFNVNEQNFPDDIKNISTSLYNEFGTIFYREDIIREFLFVLEKNISFLFL